MESTELPLTKISQKHARKSASVRPAGSFLQFASTHARLAPAPLPLPADSTRRPRPPPLSPRLLLLRSSYLSWRSSDSTATDHRLPSRRPPPPSACPSASSTAVSPSISSVSAPRAPLESTCRRLTRLAHWPSPASPPLSPPSLLPLRRL